MRSILKNLQNQKLIVNLSKKSVGCKQKRKKLSSLPLQLSQVITVGQRPIPNSKPGTSNSNKSACLKTVYCASLEEFLTTSGTSVGSSWAPSKPHRLVSSKTPLTPSRSKTLPHIAFASITGGSSRLSTLPTPTILIAGLKF